MEECLMNNELRTSLQQQVLAGNAPECSQECKKSKLDLLREYEIRISFLSVGCIVNVGCKNIPFSTVKEGMDAINAYVSNPEVQRERWNKIREKKEKTKYIPPSV